MTLHKFSPLRALSCWLSIALLSSPLVAEIPGAAEPPPPSAAALVADADPTSSVFRVDPSGGVTHIQSGMTCVLGSEKLRLTKLIIVTTAKLGDDVACDYVTPGGKTTIFATRANGRDIRLVAFDIFRAMKVMYPKGELAEPPLVASYPGLPDPHVGSLKISGPHGNQISSAWVAQAGDWVVEVRATYPASERHDNELLAAVGSISARMSINKAAGQTR
jgi:hypothetical protein